MPKMKAMLILLALFLASPLKAATARLLPVKSVGVSETIVAAYNEFLRQSLKQAKYKLLSGENGVPDVTLIPSITKLGKGFVLGLEKLTKSGEAFDDTFKVASEEDLDVGTKRLVKAVLAGESAAKAETVDDVTSAEVHAGTAMQETVKRVAFAFGPMWNYGFGSSALMYDFKLAYVWERDQLAPRLFTDVNWGPGITQAFSAVAGLGLDYYLTPGKTAPFIGADIGLGGFHRATNFSTQHDGSSMFRSGFTLGANVGYAIMRTADTSLFVQATYRPVLGGFGGKGAGLYGLEIGILY